MKKKIFLSATLLMMTLCLSFTSFVFADAPTAEPVTPLTDNLIGANDVQWKFTATTTAELVQGDVVQFIFPSFNNARPFDIDGVTLAATTSIDLYSITDPLTPGIERQMQNNIQTVAGFVNETIPSDTTFSVTLGGLNNASGQLSAMSDLIWTVRAGTLADGQGPAGDLFDIKFSSSTTPVSLVRAGGALYSDSNSGITASSYVVGAEASYTFSITATTTVPVGGKVVINFPAEFDLLNATVTTQVITAGGATVANGAIATSTTDGNNKVQLTVSEEAIGAGEVVTVIIDGLTNPATADVYRPFFVYTTESNDGLIDGSYQGFEPGDYGGGRPSPVDTIHIGGQNTLIVSVQKQSGSGTTALSESERSMVKVAVGCPDKQFFVGERWLDANSTARFENILDCNYIIGTEPFDESDNSFYDTFLPPGMKSAQLVGGVTSTSTIVFGVPNATTTLKLTGGVSGEMAFIDAFSNDFQSFGEVFTDINYDTPGFAGNGDGFVSLRTRAGQTWNFTVTGGEFGGDTGNFVDGSGNKYWPPTISSHIPIVDSTTDLGSFAYVAADKILNVSLLKSGTSDAMTDACVGVKRSGGGLFMPSQDQICGPNYNNNTEYQFKVPLGTVTIEVMRRGKPESYPVAISGATTNKTIYISAPTSYISVTVIDSNSVPINGAPVFANGSNGFANGMTGTSGTATLYVPPGTYRMEGFAPSFGKLTAQTGIIVTDSSNPAVTFTVDTSSLMTISGQVTQGGSGLAGVQIGAHGTGDTTGGNGTETNSEGEYTLYLPAGTYEIGGWSPNTGGLQPQTVDISSASESGIDWSLGVSGSLSLTIQNGSTLNKIFAGVFDPATGRGNGTNTWTTSGTSKVATMTLPAGTYEVHAGSPAIGEIGYEQNVVIAGSETTNVTFNVSASTTLVTLSGNVTDGSSVAVPNANVWVSRINGPGFFSAQTDDSGDYSIVLPDTYTYRMGVKTLGYIADQGDVEVAMAGNGTQDFTLTSAGATITGTITAGGSALANAWVSAKKIVGSTEVWTGSPTDASGGYSLTVDSGTWTVYGEGPCYLRSTGLSATADSADNDIALTARSGCTAPTPQIQGVTAASGGQVSKGNMMMDIPPNALGTGNSTVSVSVSDAPLVVSTSNASPLKGSVQRILATDSAGSSISQLNTDVTLTIDYDPDELPNGFDEAHLQLAYFDDTAGQWEPVEATVDTTNNQLTAQVSHFTDYGPILPGVPDAPTGLTATAVSATQIDLEWTAVPEADTYVIYRSLTDSDFTTQIATGTLATYSDTGLTASTQYYYKVAGVNDNGEGFSSSSDGATTNSAGGGGSHTTITTYSTTDDVTATTTATTTVPVTATTTVATTTATTTVVLIPATSTTMAVRDFINLLITLGVITPDRMPAVNVYLATLNDITPAVYTKTLKLDSENDEVRNLQTYLALDPNLYPKALITGYYGPLTKSAVIRFQKKYGIDPIGIVGPLTRAKLNELNK